MRRRFVTFDKFMAMKIKILLISVVLFCIGSCEVAYAQYRKEVRQGLDTLKVYNLPYTVAESLWSFRQGAPYITSAALSGYVPTSRTITVAANNPISSSAGAQDLSTNRTWTLSADTTTNGTGLATLYRNGLKLNSSDTTSIRNYSNSLYLKNADSITLKNSINVAGTLSNVAYENQANVFTADQTIQGNATIGIASSATGKISFKTSASTKDFTLTVPDNLGIASKADTLPNKSGTIALTSDTTDFRTTSNNMYLLNIDTVYRTSGKDSIQFTIDGRYHAIKDSVGGGGSVDSNNFAKLNTVNTFTTDNEFFQSNGVDVTLRSEHGTNYSILHFKRSLAGQTAVTNTKELGAIQFSGFGATQYISGGSLILADATQTWTDANAGSSLKFYTTPNNSTTRTLALTIGQNQAVTLASPLAIGSGGLGLSSTPTNGQLPVGNGSGYTLATLTGTTNQVTVTNGAGTITLSTPQNIHTGASPTFAGATLNGTMTIKSGGTLVLGETGVFGSTITIRSAGDSYDGIIDRTTLTAERTWTFPNVSGTVALTANNLGAFVSTSSSQLAGVISDETGSGALVFGSNPTMTGIAFATGTSPTKMLDASLRNSASSANYWFYADADNYWNEEGTQGVKRLIITPKTNDATPQVQLKPYGTGAAYTSVLAFYELVANGTHSVGFKAPDNIAATKWWVLPNTDGSSGQAIVTNGSSTLSWASIPPAGAPVGAQYVTLATDASLTAERVLTGTANQITVTDGGAGGNVTLSLPQNIATSSDVNFGSVTTTGGIKSSGTAGIGYTTGAGDSVGQATSKTTGVTINKICGRILTFNTSMNAGTEAKFTVTNSTVAEYDVPVLAIAGGGTSGSYMLSVSDVTNGTFDITLTNVSSGALGENIIINFVVIKGARN